MTSRTGFIAVLLVAAAGIGCTQPADENRAGGNPPVEAAASISDAPTGFQTAIAAVPQRNYDLYWLGPSFSSEGIQFTGPAVAGIGDENDAEAVQFSYVAARRDGAGSLNVSLMSSQTWAKSRHLLDQLPIEGVADSSIQINGERVRMVEIPRPDEPVSLNKLMLILERERTVIIASANALGSPTPGAPDRNPLLNAANLIAVLEQLRPYPS